MDHEHPLSHLGPDPFSPEGKALITSNLWMRTGFIGASAVAIGVITLFTGDWQPLAALATMAAGGALAVLAWRRSWTLLARFDDERIAPAGGAAIDACKPAAATPRPREFAADWATG